jgi:hypothetical protein
MYPRQEGEKKCSGEERNEMESMENVREYETAKRRSKRLEKRRDC